MRYLHGLLIVGALSLCCGTLGSEEPSQSQIAARALKSLEAERNLAVQRLAKSQRDIEAERKALLAAIAKAQASLRQQQQDHDETVSNNRQLEQQVANARQAQQTRQIEVGRLSHLGWGPQPSAAWPMPTKFLNAGMSCAQAFRRQ